METKHDKFVRLRDARMKSFKNLMRLFSNFSNRSNYTFSKEEADALCDEMQRDVERLRVILKGGKEFNLDARDV